MPKKSMIRKVAVIGLGYVGLPTKVAILRSGLYEVVGFDISDKVVDLLKKGKSPIQDDDVERYLKTHKLNISTDEKILQNSTVFIIAVPTPVHDDYQPDYSYVISASRIVAKYLKKGDHIVLESTVNPGTSREVLLPEILKVSGLSENEFNLAHCPERINPGDPKWGVYNIARNIGSINIQMNNQIAEFYRSFINKAEINEVSTIEVAESTKIVENAFRDINIAYVNELAKSFDAMGIDLVETIKGASTKPFAFIPHWPGAGVGGHCIAVDPYYLINRAAMSGFDHKFLKLAREINNSMPEYAVQKLMIALNEAGLPVKGTKIAVLGLSYKPDIADLRESPAIKIVELLEKLGGEIITYDPYVPNGSSTKSLGQALKGTKAVLLATAHSEFIEKLPKQLENSGVKVVIDGRNKLNHLKIKRMNIIYKGIGR